MQEELTARPPPAADDEKMDPAAKAVLKRNINYLGNSLPVTDQILNDMKRLNLLTNAHVELIKVTLL